MLSTAPRLITEPARDRAFILWFDEVSIADIPLVGGKNASLGEMIQQLAPKGVNVAVRSSATAEDLPDASFAGQQETYLNVHGVKQVIDACHKCFASIFTDRAISYRTARGCDHLNVYLSVGVQKMVRSDLAASGVMFSIDPETGFRNAASICAAYGLGENVVQGAVNPDEFLYLSRGDIKSDRIFL
jgi:pyruvate, water dikinase